MWFTLITSILTATISLIARNALTIPGIVIIILFVIGLAGIISHIMKYREWYYLFLVFLWIVLFVLSLVSAQAIGNGSVRLFTWIKNKVG